MKKTCLICTEVIEDSAGWNYNGEGGWFCQKCCAALSEKFATIFCEQIENSDCGPVLSWSAIHRILGLIQRNNRACQYQIYDIDRSLRQEVKPITTDDIAEHLEK